MPNRKAESDESHELDRAISSYLDSTLTEDEEFALACRLESNAAEMRRFAEIAKLHADIRAQMRAEEFLRFLKADEQPTSEPVLVLRRFWRHRPSRLAVTAVAASLAVVVSVLALRPTASRVAERPDEEFLAAPSNADSEKAAGVPIATLVSLRDCRWTVGQRKYECGQPLSEGAVVALEGGVAELAFENGVKVVLTAPCVFEIRGEMLASVRRGSVVARVPPRARGFSIVTPSSEVIDLGTEFGIAVDGLGESEVHVFEGEVISRWSNAETARVGRSVRLRKNDAVRFATDASKPARITADESLFIRNLAPRLKESELPPLPVREDLALWLNAGYLVQTGNGGRVSSWGDLVCGAHQSFEVALQLEPVKRPELVTDAINGRPAVRFDGRDDCLVTTPLETTDDQTVFSVVQFTNTTPARGQVINYNGPPHRVLSFPSTPGVLQINARRFPGGALRFAAMVHSGSSSGKRWETEGHVVKVLKPSVPSTSRPLVLTYCYDTVHDEATLYLNGSMVGQQTAPWPAGLVSRKVIGRHGYSTQRHLNGDVAELVIYNRALNTGQIASVNAYLAKRYGLEPPGVEAGYEPMDSISAPAESSENHRHALGAPAEER